MLQIELQQNRDRVCVLFFDKILNYYTLRYDDDDDDT